MNYLNWENIYLDELKGVNRKKHIQKIKITKYLYVHGSKSNADICSRLKISSPTSLGIIKELQKEGLVEKQGKGKSIGGRKPDLFGLKNNSLFVLGIEMGKYKTRMSIFNNNNANITDIETFPPQLNNDLATADRIYVQATKLIKSSKIDPQKLIGIGINMPGLVDSKMGINYTYLNFGDRSIRQILEEKFNRPVYIENDAKAIALAEHRFGLAKGKKDALVIFLDWGIGLGIIQDGKVYRGTSGFAGEFSHIPFAGNGHLCRCGKQGCLETIASGTALARMVKEGIQEGRTSLLTGLADIDLDQIEPDIVVDAANKGDQYAINLLSEIGMNLGKGIAILIQLFNPETIILGGRVAEAKEYLTTPIQQSLNKYCMAQLREKTSIVISELGQKVGIMGAVAMVMENIFEDYIRTSTK
jgi:N-acetylglucosamine repressor